MYLYILSIYLSILFIYLSIYLNNLTGQFWSRLEGRTKTFSVSPRKEGEEEGTSVREEGESNRIEADRKIGRGKMVYYEDLEAVSYI